MTEILKSNQETRLLNTNKARYSQKNQMLADLIMLITDMTMPLLQSTDNANNLHSTTKKRLDQINS